MLDLEMRILGLDPTSEKRSALFFGFQFTVDPYQHLMEGIERDLPSFLFSGYL